ncbi:hypothetical protein RYX36_036651 [Vicia faba]
MVSQPILLALFLVLFVFLLKLFLSKKYNKPKEYNVPYPPSPPAIPIIGHLHLLKPLLHHAFRDLSDRYGPVISLRLGSARFIVVNTPSLAKEILKTNELVYSSRKMNIVINTVVYDNATFAFAPYGTYWKFIKKLSTFELLGNQTLGQFLPIRTRELHEFIRTLANKSKFEDSLNLTQALMTLSNNIISRMMLSIETSGTDSQAEQARVLVREVTLSFGEFNISDFIGFCKNFDLQGLKKKALDLHKRYDAFLEKIICDREESRKKFKVEGESCVNEEEKVKDFLDILLDVSEAKDSEVDFTRNHIKSLILMTDSESKILGYGKKIDMDERPGLTAPRANDLFGIPVARLNPIPLLQV